MKKMPFIFSILKIIIMIMGEIFVYFSIHMSAKVVFSYFDCGIKASVLI
jgi:hypothetical protein